MPRTQVHRLVPIAVTAEDTYEHHDAERTAPPNCELIIVNDGSRQPRTLEILALLKELGYYVHDQPNLGLSGARNAAIARARGRYILPLDDDNRLRPGYISDAVQQ